MPLSFQRLSSKMKNLSENAHSNAVPVKSNESAGSFLCPQCMIELNDANELQAHFSAFHEVSENRDGDIATLRAEVNDLRSSLKEEKWYSAELKKEIEGLQAKLQDKVSSSATTSRSGNDEINYYMQQINMLEAGKALVTSQMMDLEKQVSELKRSVENLKRENSKLLEKSCSFSQQNAELSAKLDEESGQKTALAENLQKLQEKVVDLEAQLDARPSEDDVIVLRKELVHAQTLMNDLTCDRESEAAKLRVKCLELEDKCRQFEEIVKDLTAKTDKVTSSNEEYEKLKKALSDTEEHYTMELRKMTDEKIMVTEETERLRASLANLEGQLSTMTEKYEQFRTELTSVSSQFSEANALKLQEKAYNELKTKYEREKNDFRADIRLLRDESESLYKQCDVTRNELERSQNNVNSLQGTVYELQQKLEKEIKNTEDLKKQILEQKDCFEKDTANFKNEKSELVNDSKRKEEELEQQINKLSRELESRKDENLKLSEEILRLQKVIDEISQRENELKSKLNDNQQHHIQQEHESGLAIKTLQETVAELKAECLRLQEQLSITMKTNEQETGELNHLVNNLEKNLDDLKKQRDDHQTMEHEAKNQIEKLNLQLLDLEKLELQHKDQIAILTFDNASKQSVIDELNYKMEEVEGNLILTKKDVTEKQKLLADLKKEYNELKQSTDQINGDYGQTKSELDSTKKELKTALQTRKDLEAQLNAWNDEKRILLEKCVLLEKYLDEEKDNGRELKRRLDDAISAMHELGRENQSMQIDMSKHFNRKWADDNEAINCTACGKQFTVTIRKHHCRNCGLIFCNECSSKAALVVAAKKPVRVCDICFTDLNSR